MARARLRQGWEVPKARVTLRLPARPVGRIGLALGVRLVALAAVFGLAFGFGYLRTIPTPSALAAEPTAPGPDDPRYALFTAADLLDARLAADGPGLSFTATQVQILKPAPDGPPLLLEPDRDHPDRVPTAVDSIVVGSLSGRGAAHGDAFFAEWFNGTDEAGQPTYQGARAYAGLAHGGQLWRADEQTDALGEGWVPSSDVPGFGVDPQSLLGFSEALRRLDNVNDLGTDTDGHHFSGSLDGIWYPGAVAVDGAAFTGSPIQLDVWIGADGQLVTLIAVAQNLNETTYQLICADRIVFGDPAAIPIPDAPQASANP